MQKFSGFICSNFIQKHLAHPNPGNFPNKPKIPTNQRNYRTKPTSLLIKFLMTNGRNILIWHFWLIPVELLLAVLAS
jgi:hypothetical protein